MTALEARLIRGADNGAARSGWREQTAHVIASNPAASLPDEELSGWDTTTSDGFADSLVTSRCQNKKPRIPGTLKGKIWVSDDFDEPMIELWNKIDSKRQQ